MKDKFLRFTPLVCSILSATWATIQIIKASNGMSYLQTLWDNSGVILFSLSICWMIFVFSKGYIDYFEILWLFMEI